MSIGCDSSQRTCISLQLSIPLCNIFDRNIVIIKFIFLHTDNNGFVQHFLIVCIMKLYISGNY